MLTIKTADNKIIVSETFSAGYGQTRGSFDDSKEFKEVFEISEESSPRGGNNNFYSRSYTDYTSLPMERSDAKKKLKSYMEKMGTKRKPIFNPNYSEDVINFVFD